MNQIDIIANTIDEWISGRDVHTYGQNLIYPSFISGIGKVLASHNQMLPSGASIFNTTNSELTSVGYGIGRSLCGKDSLLIMKQQDFLYLALDQLVNSLCNLPSDIETYGTFTIICLVSDVPCEGTQAWSNNTSLYECLPPSIEVSYCYNASMLSSALNSVSSHYRLLFLSNMYVYKSNRFTSLSLVSGDALIWFKGELGSAETYVFLGFVDEQYLSSISSHNTILIPQRIQNLHLTNWLVGYVNRYSVRQITIVDSTSSNSFMAEALAFRLSHDCKIDISTVSTRDVQHRGFYLNSQSQITHNH